MARRREFTQSQKEQIVARATRDGAICCEGCGLVLAGKAHEIDHVIPEALRPEADKLKPLTIADGQLLGKDCCHRGEAGKTNKDVKQIAKAKRQAAGHLKIKTRPVAKIPTRPGPVSERTARNQQRERPPMPPRRNPYTHEEIR